MDPFLGEIRILGANFAPIGWAQCNGQLLQIQSAAALFSLLGTAYGGDGVRTFGLPNLQGRVPIHQGQGPGLTGRVLGETGGVPAVTLTVQQVPLHNHAFNAGVSDQRSSTNVTSGQVPADVDTTQTIYAAAGGVAMHPLFVQPLPASLPHDNMQPALVLNFCIAMQGVFPPRS